MSIHRGFKNKFVTWVAQLRTPDEMRLDRLRHCDDCIGENPDLIKVET